MVRCLLLESSIPPRFWQEALTTAVHLINRLPSSKLQNQIPYSRLFKTQPIYTHLHQFGHVCFVHLPLLNVQSYPLNLPNVQSKVMPLIKKDIFAMIQSKSHPYF